MPKRLHPYPIIVICFIMILAACASIGSPDGGPRDYTPPKVVKCQPANMSTNNQDKKLTLSFDEYIVLENASDKVVVSPPQNEMPDIRTAGKKIHITLHDSLKSNTTYTIDFSDAIVDNNEGNPMGNFTYAFSTGAEIDSMEVSGTLLEAENLEPVKGMMVGLYSDLSDTAFTTRPFARVSRTNGSGQFSIKGVAPGKYRIYGLQDMDGDFRFSQKSEKIAFDSIVISPSSAPDTRQDTTWIDSTHIDTIKTVHFTHFYPDNIVLRAFTEANQDLHLLKTERNIPDMFTIYFTAPSDTIPVLKGLNFNYTPNDMLLERSQLNDTLTYWITDTLISNKDTLSFSLTYLDTDTLGQLSYRTDTLELVAKTTRTRQLKDQQEKIEDWDNQQKKLMKRQKEKYVPQANPYLHQSLNFKMQPSGGIAPTDNIEFTIDEPVASVDTTALHFYKQKDSLWIEEPFLFLPVKGDIRSYMLYAEWQPGEKYKLETDSNAIRSILGKETLPIKKEISATPEDEFSSLFIRLILPDTGAVVQLMDNSDKVIRSVKAVNNRADFFYLKPGDYYLRLFIDRNGDGEWTTGDYATQQEPEEVFYFPKQLSLKARWEVEQDWDVRGIPLNKQKPEAITKQKPDAKKKITPQDDPKYRNR
ncbi:MAG: Ig-like domain-containing protein [Paraprevotella sp.]|nr:Ig-like domain-containing protein [Paraprevotella sp.]